MYNCELPKLTPEGKVDRSSTLLKTGRVLYDAVAKRWLIVDELAEVDVVRYQKYRPRADASEQYNAIVHELERRGRSLRRVRAPAEPTGGSNAADDGHLDCRETNRLRGLLLGRDDRLEVLEPIVAIIDEGIARPDEELSSDDNIVDIVLSRWLPHYQNKKEANCE